MRLTSFAERLITAWNIQLLRGPNPQFRAVYDRMHRAAPVVKRCRRITLNGPCREHWLTLCVLALRIRMAHSGVAIICSWSCIAPDADTRTGADQKAITARHGSAPTAVLREITIIRSDIFRGTRLFRARTTIASDASIGPPTAQPTSKSHQKTQTRLLEPINENRNPIGASRRTRRPSRGGRRRRIFNKSS